MSFQNASAASLRPSDAWKRSDAVVGELRKTLDEASLLQDPPTRPASEMSTAAALRPRPHRASCATALSFCLDQIAEILEVRRAGSALCECVQGTIARKSR